MATKKTSYDAPTPVTDKKKALQSALSQLEKSFGKGAVVGDKTLIDALVPTADKFTELAKKGEKMFTAMVEGAKAAVKGAEATKFIQAKLGRAGVTDSEGYPDAGAYGLGVIFTEIANHFKK